MRADPTTSFVAVGEGRRRVDALVTDERAVFAPEVFEHGPQRCHEDARVMPGHRGRVHPHRGPGVAADHVFAIAESDRARVPQDPARGAASARERCGLGSLDRCDEAITAARQRHDIARVADAVAERATDLVDGLVEPVLEVHEHALGPGDRTQLFPSDELARPLQERGQDPERQLLERDQIALAAQLTGMQVQLEGPEAGDPAVGKAWERGAAHRTPGPGPVQSDAHPARRAD